MTRDLAKKIRWFFENESRDMTFDDFELLEAGFFDNEGNIVFKKAVVHWRDFREFLDKKESEQPK